MSGATWSLGGLVMAEGHSNFHWYKDVLPTGEERNKFSVLVLESSGWHDSPAVREASTDRPGADGVFDGPVYYGGRTITIVGEVRAAGEEQLLAARDFILPLAKRPTPLVVEEPPASARELTVRRSMDVRFRPVTPYSADLQVQLFAPDPFKYSAGDPHSESTPLPSFGDGWSYDYAYDYSYGDPGTAGTVRATNHGTQPTWPALVIRGPVVDPTVTLAGDPRTLSFGIVLGDGDELTVDTYTRSVMLNGTASRRGTMSARSEWWPLQPGDNNILFGARSSSGGALLTVRWKDAWI